MRRVALVLVLLAGCSLPEESYFVDMPDVDLDAPEDLPARLEAFRTGREPGHGDPAAVADAALRKHLDVPWKMQAFHPRDYEVLSKPEWGTYVVRGFEGRDGRETRYRVKLLAYQEIWYPVQVSRYIRVVVDGGPHGLH